MVKNSGRRLGIVLTILVGYLFAWTLIPYIHDSINRASVLVVLPLIVLISLSKRGGAVLNKDAKTLLFLIVAWVSWQFFLKGVGYSTSAWGTHSEVLIYYSIFYLSLLLSGITSDKSKYFLVLLGGICVIVGIIQYIYMFMNGLLYVNWGDDIDNLELIPTMFKQELLFFSMASFLFFLNIKNWLLKIFSLVPIALSIFIIYVIGSNATSTLLLLVFLLFALIIHINERKWRSRLLNLKTILTIVLLFILFMVVFGNDTLSFLSAVTEEINPQISLKLKQLSDFKMTSNLAVDEGNSFVTRLFLMRVDFDTWLDSPINFLFGVGRIDGFYNVSGIGRHSEFVDVLPMYGIIGGIFTLLIYYYMYRVLKRGLNILFSNYYSLFYLIFILLGVLNNIVYPQIAVVFFIVSMYSFSILNNSDYLKKRYK